MKIRCDVPTLVPGHLPIARPMVHQHQPNPCRYPLLRQLRIRHCTVNAVARVRGSCGAVPVPHAAYGSAGQLPTVTVNSHCELRSTRDGC